MRKTTSSKKQLELTIHTLRNLSNAQLESASGGIIRPTTFTQNICTTDSGR
jgi:hypothetical protein